MLFARAAANVIPRKDLVHRALTGCVERGIQSAVAKRMHPLVEIKALIPAIHLAAALPRQQNRLALTTVAACNNALEYRGLSVMPVVGDILGFHDHLEMRLLLAELLERVLRVPLERGLRLGHKARSRRCDTHAARTVGRVLAPAIGDLFANVGNAVQILIGLGRQTHHKVQLDVIPTALKGNFAGM